MHCYFASRQSNPPNVVVVREDAEAPGAETLLPLRSDLRRHSAEFNWGYGGSGPAQLSLALLADHFGRTAAAVDAGGHPHGDLLAACLYQPFKFAVVAGLPADGWTLTGEDIGAALCQLATDGPQPFWGRLVEILSSAIQVREIEEDRPELPESELTDRLAGILVAGFNVKDDYARRIVREHLPAMMVHH